MKRYITAALLAGLLFLGGCGMQENMKNTETRKHVCVIVKAMDSIHWMSVADGLQKAADDYDLALTLLYPQDESDSDTQLQMLRDAINSKPDALAVAPCDAVAAQTYLELAQENGIEAAFIDEEIETRTIPYIGSNNELVGKLAAQALAKQLPAGAQVAVIAGNEEQCTHAKRRQGFCDYIEQNTELVLKEVRTVKDSSIAGGQREMGRLMKKYPDLDGVFCCSAMMVIGAMQQRELEHRESILLVGVDTQSDALTAVRDGEILAMVSQNGYEIGYQTIAVLAAGMNGEQVDMYNYVENRTINQSNVKGFLSEYLMEGRES